MGLLKNQIVARWSNRNKKVRIGILARILPSSCFEGHNKVGKFSIFQGKMGMYSYMGDNSVVLGEVGRFTSIADRVHIIAGRHPLRAPFVSTHPAFYALKSAVGKTFVDKQLFDEYAFANNPTVSSERGKPVIIGNDCWIGEGASIISGVNISDGAVILANATVTKDVPPYAIVAGIPAKIVAYRYDEDTITKLLKIQWWNKEEQVLKDNAFLFSDIEAFLNQFNSRG